MTREEQIKYCRCCNHRKSTKEHGLVCSLTGAQAQFEDGCCDFDADEIAMKEYAPEQKHVKLEKKEILAWTLTTLFMLLMLFCYYETMVNLDFSSLETAYRIIIVLVVGLTASCWIFIKTMEEVGILSKDEKPTLINAEIVQKVLKDDGYFPCKDDSDEFIFNLKGMMFYAGINDDGFAYSRVYYTFDTDEYYNVLQSANITEQSLIAIKVLVNPQNGYLIMSVESMCFSEETYRLFLSKSIQLIKDATGRFRYEMDRLKTEQFQLEKMSSMDCPETHELQKTKTLS